MRRKINNGELRKTIGARVKIFRTIVGLNQQELAEAIGASKSTVSNWETGINGIDVEFLPAICKALEIDLNTLLGLNSDMQGLSNEAIALALLFDKLDPQSQAIVRAIADMESNRLPIPKGAKIRIQKTELPANEQPGLEDME